MKILIVYYSLYGHVQALVKAAAEGAASAGAEVTIKRVPETLPQNVIEMMGAAEAQKAQAGVPVCTPEDLAAADGIIFAAPTRFGNMCGQMRQFLDATGGLWAKGALTGKVGAAMTSSATQHGGQETTLLGFYTNLLHHGMVVAGLPYAFQGQMGITEMTGGSPYGASTITGGKGERMPSANELDGARFQGRYVAQLAGKLAGIKVG